MISFLQEIDVTSQERRKKPSLDRNSHVCQTRLLTCRDSWVTIKRSPISWVRSFLKCYSSSSFQPFKLSISLTQYPLTGKSCRKSSIVINLKDENFTQTIKVHLASVLSWLATSSRSLRHKTLLNRHLHLLSEAFIWRHHEAFKENDWYDDLNKFLLYLHVSRECDAIQILICLNFISIRRKGLTQRRCSSKTILKVVQRRRVLHSFIVMHVWFVSCLCCRCNCDSTTESR